MIPAIPAILSHYGAVGVFVVLVLENLGILPVAGYVLVVGAATYAGTGHLNIILVALASVAGTCTGSTLSYLGLIKE